MDGKLHIILFIASINLYFTRYDLSEMDPPGTMMVGYDKIVPLWLLTAYVATVIKTSTPQQRNNIRSLSLIQFGLLTSIIGEVYQMMPPMFKYIPATCFLAVTYGLYSVAFGAYSGTRFFNIIFFMAWLTGFLSMQVQITSYTIKAFVMCYSALLGNSAWRAATRFREEQTIGTCICCVGTMLFICSDYFIAYNKWVFPIPKCHFLVMLTYYAAQFGIAIGETLNVKANKREVEFPIQYPLYYYN